jgi:hypothetical protein
VLRLYDADAGEVTPVVPARPGQLCTYTAGVGEGERGAAGVRSYLLADLIRRVGEQHHLVVSAWHGGDGLGAEWEALNIHPPAAAPSPPEPLDIGIGAQPAGARARWLRSAPVTADEVDATGDGSLTAAVSGRGLDPLAVRLMLLQEHYREAVTLGWEQLAAADRLLGEWRRQVAAWANSPSKPMAAQYTTGIQAAFDDDLDTLAALQALTALAADTDVPVGSKFETFVYLDHLLGLDLARDIGRF